MVVKKDAAEADEKMATALAIPNVTDDQLRDVQTVDDAIALAFSLYGIDSAIQAGDFLGNGFKIVRDKNVLLNRPMFVLATKFHEGGWGEFVTVFAVMMDNNDRVMINDGSTGVCENVRQIAERAGYPGGWIVSNGLRKSEYATCTDCGRPRNSNVEICENCGDSSDKRSQGTTFYLDAA